MRLNQALRLCIALAALVAASAGAQDWGTLATISSTMGAKANRLCVGEGTRATDIGCPSYAPSITTTGGLIVSGTVSATSFVGDGSGLTNIGAGVSSMASLTDVSASSPGTGMVLRYNGTKWESVGVSSAMSTTTMVQNWPDAILCAWDGDTSNPLVLIHSNTNYAGGGGSQHIYYYIGVPGSYNMLFNSDGTVGINTGMATTGSYPCNVSIPTLYAQGRAFNFIGSAAASGTTALGDRLISGTLAATANSGTGYISLTTGATTWGYLSSGANYLPSLTSTVISATAVQVASDTTVCASGSAGRLSYVSGSLLLCNGSSWSNVGIGVPAGTIAAFASSTCPSGWTEYTAARGRFLRGIDNGAGNDPDGTRAPGNTQADMFKSHTHGPPSGGQFLTNAIGTYTPGTSAGGLGGGPTAATGGAETRPKNVAVTFCTYTGIGGSGGGGGATSLSGLSDVSLGSPSNGDVLTYNGSAWVNQAGGGSSADRIVSGTVSAVAEQATGMVKVSGTVALVNSGDETCDASHHYSLRINPSTGQLQMCRP